LNAGVSVWDVTKNALDDCERDGFGESFNFFNKYAPQIWPDTSIGAFIALHEGLDALDVQKFPEDTYGKADGECSMERAKAICAAHKKFGCRLDDESALLKGQVYQRSKQTGYNDVGCGIWPTNYQRFLEQIDADVTSQGLFRIGGAIDQTSSKYARFARGLRHSSNKTALRFKMHDNFFSLFRVAELKFTVTWYDVHKGSWQLQYNDWDGAVKMAIDQSMSGDGEWKQTSVKVTDAAMNHRHTRGCDFELVSRSSTDAVFHMIEVDRLEATTVVEALQSS
jgi:hypothetical protein